MALFYHPRFLEHVQQYDHPESPERLHAIIQRLKRENLFSDVKEPGPATKDELALVHDMGYIDEIRDFGEGPYDPDTYVHTETYDIACLAAGAAIDAARWSIENSKPAFALVRPPGHHATRNRAMGFCYFNNIAIAAADSLARLKRVAILDYDAHHGNGTQNIFEERADVLYISTHQWPHYPGTGSYSEAGQGRGEGFTVNIPLPASSGDATFDYARKSVITPVLESYSPEMVFVSLGCDAHYRDPLCSLALSSPGFIGLCSAAVEFARRQCGGRIMFTLEGGYYVQALAEVVAGVVASFSNRTIGCQFTDNEDVSCIGKENVDRSRKVQSRYWKNLA